MLADTPQSPRGLEVQGSAAASLSHDFGHACFIQRYVTAPRGLSCIHSALRETNVNNAGFLHCRLLFSSKMTRPSSLKRSIDVTDQQGSVKRLKSLKSLKPESYQESKQNKKKYSTRHITWDEQKRLGGDFAQVGEGCWPVLKILQESVKGRTKRYLVAWNPHPETGEEFEPVWLPHTDVSDHLITIWKQEKQKNFPSTPHQQEKHAARVARNRRVLPSSSDTPAENTDQQSDAAHSPPSLLSGSSASGLEISESQDPGAESPRVNIPPLPADKHEYETISSSQFSPSTANFFDQSSPEVHFNLPSTQKTVSSPIVSPSSPQPVSHPATAIVINGTQTPQSKVSESSPHTSSTKSKATSKLSKFVVSIEEDVQPTPDSPSQSHQFLTQLPNAQSSDNPSESPTQSPKSAQQAIRLSSPFQGTISIRDSSSPAATPQSPGRYSPHQRAVSVESLHKQATPVPEDTGLISVSPNRASPFVLPNIPAQIAETQSSVTDHFGKVFIAPSKINMASSGIDIAPLEPTGSPLFTTSRTNTFDLPHDSNALTLTIHESIEDEPQSSADNSQLLNSKANSSQESLNNEREVETVDGIMIPVRPILGPNEFAIPLPAEGKVKSQYDEIIKLQKKAVIRFISRTGSPGTSDISNKKTIERNAMQDLLQQLNNTVTHTDLGLPMHTQYSLDPAANAAYAEYAGTKFEILGYLVDSLKSKDCSIAVFAQSGSLQDLIEEYLAMKQVLVRRHDRVEASSGRESNQGLSIDLLTTQSSKVVPLERKPLFIIAFDITFTSSDLQVRSLREMHGDDLAIIHLLVTNSSEHVEKCVPDTLTSNIRLKVVVRTTYLASRNLGGDITYVPEESDQPTDGRAMDMLEFQRAVRKSPARRLFLIADVIAPLAISGELAANWPLASMPELKLNELETPPKVSRGASRTPQPRITRQSTPVSRAATPVSKRRLLEIDGENGHKRQRLTPVRDLGPESGMLSSSSDDVLEARKRISTLASELASVKHALTVVEQNEAIAQAKAEEWEGSHAGLMHRFEKERLKSREFQRENKKLNSIITNYQERDEGLRNEKTTLRQQLTDIRGELLQARKDLTSAGGDVAELENARQEARDLTSKLQALEKTMKSLKEDFEFTKDQYQTTSKVAMDRTTEVKELEDQVEKLKVAADDNKRSLKAMNYQASLTMAMNKAEQFRLEVKNREALIRKMQDENTALKTRRGVQTRGSSIQPASSPGPRSRQASPAATHLMPPSGSRTSVLRREVG